METKVTIPAIKGLFNFHVTKTVLNQLVTYKVVLNFFNTQAHCHYNTFQSAKQVVKYIKKNKKELYSVYRGLEGERNMVDHCKKHEDLIFSL